MDAIAQEVTKQHYVRHDGETGSKRYKREANGQTQLGEDPANDATITMFTPDGLETLSTETRTPRKAFVCNLVSKVLSLGAVPRRPYTGRIFRK